MKPEQYQGSSEIDREYLRSLLDAVPEGGVSWTYTHFDKALIPLPEEGKTTINISTDTINDALESQSQGYPTVVVRPAGDDSKRSIFNHSSGDVHRSIRIVRCPAEYLEHITCQNCGGGVPLCARQDRNYIIKFTAHGSGRKVIAIRNGDSEQSEKKGGCYGSGGPVHLQWKKAMGETVSDGQRLLDFVGRLPRGTMIRHHVVGDLG